MNRTRFTTVNISGYCTVNIFVFFSNLYINTLRTIITKQYNRHVLYRIKVKTIIWGSGTDEFSLHISNRKKVIRFSNSLPELMMFEKRGSTAQELVQRSGMSPATLPL